MTTSRAADSEEQGLLGFVARALELQDQGEEVDLAKICKSAPHLLPAAKELLGRASELPMLRRGNLANDDLLGQVFEGRYRLDARLGAGSMGVVYRATDLELQRLVAVKILHQVVTDQAQAEQRFVREAESLAAIQHPSVVTLFDRGRTPSGQAYFVMELLQGLSLQQLLEDAGTQGGIPGIKDMAWLTKVLGLETSDNTSYVRSAAQWAAQLAAGLAAAHDAGIYHRDVKPSNVFLRHGGGAVLIDFGVASLESKPTLRIGDGVIGTPAYMAPEALVKGGTVSPARDVYGLAATLYHMLTLRSPYAGTPSQIIWAVGSHDPKPAHLLHPGLPRDLRAILDRGLERKPAARYQTAAAFEQDLRAFLNFMPVVARPISPLTRIGRRLLRSPAVWAGTLVSFVLFSIILWSDWNATRLHRRREQWNVTWAQVPPGLTLWKIEERRLDGVEGAEIGDLLEQAVAWSDTSVPSRLYRAAFRLDHGDPSGAMADMDVVADEFDTPFSRSLARSYHNLPGDASGAGSLVLDPQIEPVTAIDKYLMGYHTLRNVRSSEDIQTARRLLGDEQLKGFAPALEVYLPLSIGIARGFSTQAERMEHYRSIYERAVRMEESLGYRSAVSAHTIGASLVGQERYQEALGPIGDGLALTPFFHGLETNMGIALRRTGALDRARSHVERALQLRPGILKNHETLVWINIDRLDFDEALRVLDAAPYETSASSQHRKGLLRAEIRYEHALEVFKTDPLEAHALAQGAVEMYEALGVDEDHPKAHHKAISVSIARGELSGAIEPIVRLLEADATDQWRIELLIRTLPEELSSSQTAIIKRYLRALSNHLSPESPTYVPPGASKAR